jgi:hypothetical protein
LFLKLSYIIQVRSTLLIDIVLIILGWMQSNSRPIEYLHGYVHGDDINKHIDMSLFIHKIKINISITGL